MSLVGNLEDLSLGDLLQIVCMSQKSGVLVVDSGAGSGHIVFRSGQVHAAGIKGRTADLRGILIAAGLLDAARYEVAEAALGAKGVRDPERLAAHARIDPDAVEAIVRKSAEAAIFEMFAWSSGEFSFDARRESDLDEGSASLRNGLNPQYLAMEGMRLRDEASRASGQPVAAPVAVPSSATNADVFFGAEHLEVEGGDEIELEADFVIEAPAKRSARAGAERSPRPAPVREDPEVAGTEEAPRVSEPAPSSAGAPAARPLVVIDPDAAALEWIKATIGARFERIHVFQRADQGLARIRQYLIRSEVPCVLISLATPIDPLSGIHGLPDFAKRLRSQSARILVIGLREAGQGRSEAVPSQLDAVLIRPTRAQLRPGSGFDPAALSTEFASELVARLESSNATSGRASRGLDPA